MKKKIFSLLMGICLIFTGLFSFSGCSLVKEDQSKVNAKVVMKVGNTELTEADVINAFYTYYNNNSSYFSYYTNDVIEESFYTWLTVKTLVEDMSVDVLYNATTNPTGYIYYTSDDAEDVWKALESYFYSQVSTYEKSIYTQQGYTDENMPLWLQAEEDETGDTKFEAYKSPVSEIVLEDRKSKVVDKLTADQVYSKIAALKERLFKYVVETDEDGNETLGNVSDIEKDYIPGARSQAYTNFMQTLILNAKANNKSTDETAVIKDEVLRIYEAYYESQISVIFQNYFTQEYLLNYKGLGDAVSLSDTAVVKSFLNQYNTEKQTYQVEDAYVSKITDTEEGASLLLYHYGGSTYYFTVQHILIKFSEKIDEEVKKLYGYSASGDYDSVIGDAYIAARNTLASEYNLAMLTPVNTKAEKDSIVSFGNYYYYDEEQKDVYDTTKKVYHGYVQLSDYSYNDSTGEITHNYFSDGGTGLLKDKYNEDEVVLMATKEDIIKAYEENYAIWEELAYEVFDGTKTVEAATEANPELDYVFETAKNMRENNQTFRELQDKLTSYLFLELEWIYSTDALGNELSNKLGYVISSHPDDNGSWVADFAIGARELVEADPDKDAIYSTGEVSNFTKTVVSDYGYHIMKVENVYKTSSIINLDGISANYDLSENSDYVKAVASLLKKNYVSTTSNQTLFEYFYDALYKTLVGDSETSGTYFLAKEYEWLHKLNEDGKVEIIDRIDYDTLLESLT